MGEDLSAAPLSLLDLTGFTDPTPLVRQRQGAPAKPGVYLITAGSCLAHIGMSSKIQVRMRTMAGLGNHRASAKVLCSAFCTGEHPQVLWREMPSKEAAEDLELSMKHTVGQPPLPADRFSGCHHGVALRNALIDAAGGDTADAGYIEAVFDVGEQLKRLFAPRFHNAWREVGVPPGPWDALISQG